MRDRGVGERVQENEGARGTEMEGERERQGERRESAGE
jgi:hypothetical protein